MLADCGAPDKPGLDSGLPKPQVSPGALRGFRILVWLATDIMMPKVEHWQREQKNTPWGGAAAGQIFTADIAYTAD
jgi:hypothetical protein